MSGPWEKYATQSTGPWQKYAPKTGVSQPPPDMFMNPETGQMTSRELLRNQENPNALSSIGGGYLQGYTFNTFDEGMGEIGRAIGGEDEARFRREQARAKFEAQRENNPVAFAAGNVAGAVMNPAVRAVGPVNSVRGGATLAAGEGFLSAAGGAEGAIGDRAVEGAAGGAVSFLLGGATSAAVKYGSQTLRRMATRSQKRPTLGSLRAERNRAYQAVREAGVNFSQDDMIAAWSRLDDLAKDPRWDLDQISEVDKPAFDALRAMQRRAEAGRPISLNNLDKTRQKMWDIYTKSDNPFVLEVVDEIDNVIARKAEGSQIMSDARLANARYKKTEVLENAFRKARLQTGGTGSGGNILNKYRQAVTRIITTPREAKYFSAEELALMEQFVTGDNIENTLRRVGKIAPGGNGLMSALNLYAATVDPTLLAVSAVGAAAKEGADKSAMQGSSQILDAVSTGVIDAPKPSPDLRGVAVAAGAFGGS